MSTRLVIRPAVKALPGPAKGALVAPHHDPRPCVINPPQWWDTGHKKNVDAINLCKTQCPLRLRNECKPASRYTKPTGVIRAGVAYNDRGNALKQCPTCQRPMAEWYGNSSPRCGHCTKAQNRNPAECHHDIAELVAAKKSWSYIGANLNLNPDAARSYWIEHTAKQRASAEGRILVRLPGVTDDSRNKPSAHADLVISMLTDREHAYTAEEVAWVIGSTLDAVKSWWLRERKRRIAAGEDMPGRRYICNAVRKGRPKRVAA